jgi:glucose-1-phosphate thymidylyltransferase
MKGVILAGGVGTRLYPLTAVINKCLLPVYNKPMIYYPINLLVDAGIRDILLVCGGNSVGDFLPLLKNGEAFGINHLHYTVQDEPRGIADALGLAREFVDNDTMAVVLADNIFENSVTDAVLDFALHPNGAAIFGARVEHPEHYGVIEMDDSEKVTKIVEKPKSPKTNMIATGLYLYDQTVWGYIEGLTPSARGELEITDVNNHYLSEDRLRLFQVQGGWADCGENFDGYLNAGIMAKQWEMNRGSST